MADKGTLVTQVYTARRAIPIAGASVTVSKKNGEDMEVITYRRTDWNGITEPVEIETPDAEASLFPSAYSGCGNEDGDEYAEPFTSVTIQIDHPMYYSVKIENAQIFPGQISMQQIELVPLPEFPDGSADMIYRVSPQDL